MNIEPLTLTQSFFHHQTLFAFIAYSIAVLVLLPAFYLVHEKLNHHYLQAMWDKIGMPLLRTVILIGFILLIYPLNYGLAQAPALSELMGSDNSRRDFLVNIVFLLTFLYPFIPLLGKSEEFIIPLQGILCSMILFRWLCQALGVNDYSLIVNLSTFLIIICIAFLTHWLAKHLSAYLGQHLDNTLNRQGFVILSFHAIIMIMQSPIIFLYSQSLGHQLLKPI